jgi:rhodanese-related sulfurtransferase
MLNSGLCTATGWPSRTGRRRVTITPGAAEKIREAMQGHEGIALHFQVDANWDTQFNLAPPQGQEIVSESNGIRILMDIATAQRARGAVIDWVSTVKGEAGHRIAPRRRRGQAVAVRELAEARRRSDPRSTSRRADRALASIEGAVVLDRSAMELLGVARDVALAFPCQLRRVSMGAAEYFRKQGFTNGQHVAGGINARSMESILRAEVLICRTHFVFAGDPNASFPEQSSVLHERPPPARGLKGAPGGAVRGRRAGGAALRHGCRDQQQVDAQAQLRRTCSFGNPTS